MNDALSIARTGLSAATLRLDSAAHNIANAITPGMRRQQVVLQTQAEGGVAATLAQAPQAGEDLVTDIVEQHLALYSFQAQLQIIKAQDRMVGSLLDTRA
jgi:flagellar basal body rod protein FlgF